MPPSEEKKKLVVRFAPTIYVIGICLAVALAIKEAVYDQPIAPSGIVMYVYITKNLMTTLLGITVVVGLFTILAMSIEALSVRGDRLVGRFSAVIKIIGKCGLLMVGLAGMGVMPVLMLSSSLNSIDSGGRYMGSEIFLLTLMATMFVVTTMYIWRILRVRKLL